MSKHFRSSQELTAYAEGSLAAAERRAVESHLADCEECRGWIAAYRLLAEGLADPAGHLSADDLSRFALAEETLDASQRERCVGHVEICASCAEEIQLVRGAASEARRVEPAAGRDLLPAIAPAARKVEPATVTLLALAAGLLLVVGVSLVGGGAATAPRNDQIADSDLGAPAFTSSTLSGSSLTDHRTVQNDDSILVEETRIEPGADLILRSGNSVVFGDGFQVAPGGTLSVVVEAL